VGRRGQAAWAIRELGAAHAGAAKRRGTDTRGGRCAAASSQWGQLAAEGGRIQRSTPTLQGAGLAPSTD